MEPPALSNPAQSVQIRLEERSFRQSSNGYPRMDLFTSKETCQMHR